MIVDTLSINQCVSSIETVLRLEYTQDAKLDELISSATKRLEEKYGLTIDKDIYTLQAENQLASDTLSRFLADITECLKLFSLYTTLQTFHHNMSFSLSQVNYLGYARQQLMASLKYFLDKDMYAHREDVVKAISMPIDKVPLNIVKRLFVAMLFLEKLGISEGVAIIGHILYMGGIVE